MHKYIEELTELISNCPMDNTYKMSWCKALVEYLYHHSDKKVHFDGSHTSIKKETIFPLHNL